MTSCSLAWRKSPACISSSARRAKGRAEGERTASSSLGGPADLAGGRESDPLRRWLPEEPAAAS